MYEVILKKYFDNTQEIYTYPRPVLCKSRDRTINICGEIVDLDHYYFNSIDSAMEFINNINKGGQQ